MEMTHSRFKFRRAPGKWLGQLFPDEAQIKALFRSIHEVAPGGDPQSEFVSGYAFEAYRQRT